MNIDEINARINDISNALKQSNENYQTLNKAITDCMNNHNILLGRLAEAEDTKKVLESASNQEEPSA